MRRFVTLIFLISLVAGIQSVAQSAALPEHAPNLARQQWSGESICYSGYRGAENPDKNLFPSDAEVLQDLQILQRHWQLLRLYGSDAHSESVLRLIHAQRLPLKVMLGIWLTGAPGHEADNEKQLAAGIALARQYTQEVAAVSVGNEALVSWSDHAVTEPQMIAAVERVKHAVTQPVTVDDDYLYWMKPDAALAGHVDFIALHIYPVWGREDIDTALATTEKLYEKVRLAHPGKAIVLGEVGWPSYTVGEKHAPRAGDEHKQKVYFQQISQWARLHQATAFVFEAFDEPWKGTGTEGHWGLFSEQRKAKPAVLEFYPELKPSAPTSPSYDGQPAPVVKP
jgi:exo-beta-1,3-glucanase (GH17 family)